MFSTLNQLCLVWFELGTNQYDSGELNLAVYVIERGNRNDKQLGLNACSTRIVTTLFEGHYAMSVLKRSLERLKKWPRSN